MNPYSIHKWAISSLESILLDILILLFISRNPFIQTLFTVFFFSFIWHFNSNCNKKIFLSPFSKIFLTDVYPVLGLTGFFYWTSPNVVNMCSDYSVWVKMLRPLNWQYDEIYSWSTALWIKAIYFLLIHHMNSKGRRFHHLCFICKLLF